jgi:hypothetical protein
MKIDQVEQDTYEYDTDGRVTLHEHKLIEKRQFGVCQEALCALYRKGKCMYNITHYDSLEGYYPQDGDYLEGCEGCDDETET